MKENQSKTKYETAEENFLSRLKYCPIYIEGYKEKDSFKTLEEIAKCLGAHKHRTMYTNGTLQCDAGYRRSISDLLRVVKYYLPEVTLRDIMKYLYNPESKMLSLVCSDIHKLTFINGDSRDFGVSDYERDEFGFSRKDYENA